MDPFVSLANLRECEDRFRAHMSAKHGLDLADSAGLRKVIYGVMKDVRARSPTGSLKSLNNATLNAVREIVLRQQQPTQPTPQPPQPTPQPHPEDAQGGGHGGPAPYSYSALQRDRDVFGARPVLHKPDDLTARAPDPMRSEASTSDELMRRFDRADKEYQQPKPRSWVDVARPTQTVGAMDTGEFESRLAELSRDRDSYAAAIAASPPPQQSSSSLSTAATAGTSLADVGERPDAWTAAANASAQGALAQQGALTDLPDPLELARMALKDRDDFAATLAAEGQQQQQLPMMPLPSARAEALILAPPDAQRAAVPKYLTLNAGDRDVAANPRRFQFSARTGGQQGASTLQQTYRNVAWIEATRVILPMELMSATGTVVTPKGYYNIEQSFAFPYVMLLLQDFEGVYDGTNDLMRRTFAMFVYDNDYKAPNGRGYVLLQPAQLERKEFMTPLASLPDLRLSLVKPNGTLFNNSVDSYTVSLLQYEPQNRLYLKVVVDQFFDANELWVGDYVRLSGLAAHIVAARAAASNAIQTTPGYLAALLEYVNRPEGFEIVQLGASNPSGFYNAFYVLAPGVLDQTNGSVIVDQNMVVAVLAMGTGAADATATVSVTVPGRLLNMSLQPVFTFRVGCVQNTFSGARA